MAFLYRAAGTAALATNVTSQTPALPAGVAAGDLLVLQCQNFGGTNARQPSVGSDWTSYVWQNGAASHLLAWKIAGASESAPTVTWSGTGASGDDMLARVFAFYSDTANRIIALADAGTSSTNASADNIGPITGVTVPTGGGLTVISAGKTNDFNGQGALTNWTQAALTERTTGNDAGMSLLYRLATPAGATGNLTVADNGGTNSLGAGFGRILAFVEQGAGSGTAAFTLASSGAGEQPAPVAPVLARGTARPIRRRTAPLPTRRVRGRHLARAILAVATTALTGVGGAGFTLGAAATGQQTATGSGGAALTLGTSGSGQQAQSGAGGAGFGLVSTGTGTQAAGGAGGASFTVAATATVTQTATGAGGAALTLAASGAGQQAQSGGGGAALTLATSGSGTQAAGGVGGAALTLASSATARQSAFGTGGAAFTLAATGSSGAAPASGFGGRGHLRPVRTIRRPDQLRPRSGPQWLARRDIVVPQAVGGAAFALASAGTGTQRAEAFGGAALTLGTAGAGQQAQRGSGGASLTLAAGGTGTQAATGAGGAAFALAAAGTGTEPITASGGAAFALASRGASTMPVVGAGGAAFTLVATATDVVGFSGLLCPDLVVGPRLTPTVALTATQDPTVTLGPATTPAVTATPRLAPRITLRSRCP